MTNLTREQIEGADRLREAVTEHWGERCADFDPGCPTCQAWAQLDALAAMDRPSADPLAWRLIETERTHWLPLPASPSLYTAPPPAKPDTAGEQGEVVRVNVGILNGLSDWFDRLPAGGMRKEHFDELVLTVQGMFASALSAANARAERAEKERDEALSESTPVYDKVSVGDEDFAPAKEWLSVPGYYVVAVNEFLSDWQKGDFSLSTLAALDAQNIIASGERWKAEDEVRAALNANPASGEGDD